MPEIIEALDDKDAIEKSAQAPTGLISNCGTFGGVSLKSPPKTNKPRVF
jgi:hypothetical protein